MAYDEELAERVRARIPRSAGEIKMFGGLCFTIGGNMACGVMNDDLIVRFPPAEQDAMLKRPGARPFDFMKGRPAPAGIVLVGRSVTKDARALNAWVDRGLTYAASLPAKAPKAKKAAKKPVAKKQPAGRTKKKR